MGRAPCCEKMGLKKGPWSPEEDRILITFIKNHGHSNWRALPKQAGLLRCGKSCRLRWTNYLKPDIKRGNFTQQEEDSIIKLHEMLGNRWSAIAAKLPGRTDNEIKNVWHTHLKKRLQITTPKTETKRRIRQSTPKASDLPMNSNPPFDHCLASSPSQQSSSDISSVTDPYITENEYNYNPENMESAAAMAADAGEVPPIDESFWSETAEISSSQVKMDMEESNDECYGEYFDDDMKFWFDVFVKAGGESELPEF